MNFIKNFLKISFITFFLWIFIDFTLTFFLGVRGFSQFFVSNEFAGHINKPNFSGKFGGPLDEFYSTVNIDHLGSRQSTLSECPSNEHKIIFLGDSITAGFEVNDNETFVSVINQNCEGKNFIGYNFGVRGHDTHSVIGNYKRIVKEIEHDYVYYLISLNDLTENLLIYHYKNLVKRFGRTFNGSYMAPNMNIFEKIYFSFRLFISDKFYLTTKIITFKNIFTKHKPYKKKKVKINLSPKEIIKLENLYLLILSLNEEVIKNQSRLTIAFSPDPCLIEKNMKCLLYEEWMIKKINEQNDKKFKIQKLVNEVYELSENEKINLKSLIFNRDPHFNVIGHKKIGDLIYNFYQDYN